MWNGWPGMREVSLAGELAVAGTVLRAAGIRAVLPQAVDDVDPTARQLFGYVLREAVTNVVRHSHAHTCTVELTTGSIRIANDGPAGIRTTEGAAVDLEPGNGLVGLAARVTATGGTFSAAPGAHGGFEVLATVPVARPTDAPDNVSSVSATKPAGRLQPS